MTQAHSNPAAQTPPHRGHCLCGAVQYEVRGPMRAVTYCHCNMCRRATSHFLAATGCAKEHLTVQPGEALCWYQSSAQARRGFCRVCGSQLFWEGLGEDHISIMVGSLDLPTGLHPSHHIFVEEAGDYYTITDGLPQHDTWPGA